MPDLLADRFLPCGAAWMDLASGATVRIRITAARPRGDVLAWSDWCATLAVMRHPLLNVLVDYGDAGAGRTFEAYGVSAPLAASGAAGSHLLTHAVRFLEFRGIHLQHAVADLVLRQVEASPSRAARRPFGIVLHPRPALRALDEALREAAPGGVTVLTLVGEPGSGLRTASTHAARIARVQGYVPVSAALIASAPWLTAALRARHLCVMVEPGMRGSAEAAAILASRLGVESARRHVVVRFARERTRDVPSLSVGSLGVTAMMSMVFKDRDYGPVESELMAAARKADGNPGRFLASLRASAFPEQRSTFSVVHETAPAYVVDASPTAPAPSPRRNRPAGRSIVSAEDRAVRLAARGRHASAVRLLSRATRVLDARGESDLAAACAERLGWILRERGQTRGALERFARAAELGRGSALEVRATIATGVTWTDECRFVEAEAALRSTVAAAGLLGIDAVEGRARLALARSLYWQQRYEEAAIGLTRILEGPAGEQQVHAQALCARISVATGDLGRAVTLASEAMAGSAGLPPRVLASAARAMALAQAALGDLRAAHAYIRQGLAAAAAAHSPLLALRLRAVALSLPHSEASDTGAPRHALTRVLGSASIPPLVRLQLERGKAKEAQPVRHDGLTSPAIHNLQRLLEIAYSAQDEAAGVNDVSRELCDKLRAATVQVLSADSAHRLLGRAGRPWTGDLRLVERALACPGAAPIVSSDEPSQAVHAITYAGDAIAAIACRWTAGTVIDRDRAAALLRTASLALAPTVRTLLDRSPAAPAEPAWREFIGVSPGTLALRDAITRAARAPFPVLIEGESGSGKELVARAIHRLSVRRDRKLCAVNCAAITDDLLEAELFGHARGAFTGAIGERPGLFEEADGGTLFLDEIGELSQRAQAKLLRVLQDGEVRRVGENFARRVDARVIAATNRRLEDEVDAGRFRADLRFRLDVVRISVPPLRDRPVDIPMLAAHFWEDAVRRVDSRASLSPETVLALTRYDWPGNVRQLQNVIASLAVQAPRRGRVPPSLLPAQVARTAAATATTFEAARMEFERRFVAAELARAGGQRARAARALGVTRQGLAKMMRRLGIE